MPNVVITADYSALQKATEAAKNLDAVLNGISHKRLDLTAQLRDAQSELERLALKLRQTNDEIARQRNQGKTRTDMTSLYEDQARQRSQVTAQKGVIDNLKAQDRILANQADHWKKQLNYQNDIIKTQNQAIREQEQAQAKADREAAAALAKRQEAAQKTEKSFADLQKSEVDRARAAAIDAGRSDPRTEEEWAAAFERRTQREAEAAEVERQLAEAEKERQAAADRAAEEERIRQMEEERQAALDLAAAISAVGDAFNTLGSISGGIADFSTGIANSFRSMASMFSDANVTDSLKRLAMQYFTDTFAGDLSSAISRYDILSTFVPYMQAAGVDEQTANTSLARVNESIIGIPIGLDEAAQRLRRYQMFLGDVESATNLTIGAQNAIIAGGASEQMKNMAYMQIDRLLAAGKLNTSRQWLSLIQGLGVSMNYVSQAMGTTNMTPKELAAGLTSGEISTESFLEALMELGKGESDAAAGLNNLLTIYKGTIEAWQASIRYASTRGQANVIDVLSDSLETLTGQGVTGYMKDYRDFINEVYGGIGSFISNNPELITTSLEKFNQLIDSVSKFSASEFAMNVFSRLGEGVDLISRALEHIPAGKLEEFAAFATTLAGPIGSGMLAANGLGQILGVFERFKTYDFGNLIDSIARNVGSMASAVELLLGVLPDGLMTELMAFGLVWGKPLATVLTSVGGALNSLGATLKSIAGVSTLSGAFLEGGVFGWLLQLAKMHPQLAAVATGLTAIAGAMALFASAERQSVRQLSEDLGITDFVNEMKQIQSAMDSLDIRIGVREEDLAQTETAIRQAERLREALLELDSADGEDFNAAKLAATAKELEAVLPGVDASIDATTGHLTEQARAALEDADAFEQLIAKMREAAAAAALQGAMTDLYTAEYQRDVANEAVTTAERNLRLAEYGLQRARERAYKGQWAVTPDEGETILTVTEAQKKVDLYSEALEEAEAAAQEANDTYARVNDQVGKMTDRYEEAYNAVDHTADALADDADAAAEVAEALANVKEAASELARTRLAETLKTLSEGVEDTFAGFNDWELPKPVGQGGEGVLTKDIENMEKEAEFANTASKNLDRVKEYLDKLETLDLPEGTDGAGLRTNLINYINEVLGTDDDETAAQKINNILAAFDELDWDTLLRLGSGEEATLEAQQKLTESYEGFAKWAEGANESLERAYNAAEHLPELAEALKTVQADAVKALEEAFKSNPFEEQEGGTLLERLGSTVEGKFDAAKGVLSGYTDALSQVITAYQTGSAELQTVVGEIQESMGTLKDATGEAAEEVPANTKKMEGDVSQDMSNMASNTDSSVNDTISSINKLAPAINQQVPLVAQAAADLGSGLATGLQAGVSAAQSAAASIAAAAASIAASVQAASTAAASLGTGGGSEPTGEAVLLATGGSVFRPFGSDTVPAMLTPGEYIIRKGAADFFGRGLLERINALDIGGAFDRLILNSPVTAGRYGGNVYNKDSHASVTQNYYNSSPDYGRRRAMRFAHAL